MNNDIAATAKKELFIASQGLTSATSADGAEVNFS
jgi:hypothetical protein